MPGLERELLGQKCVMSVKIVSAPAYCTHFSPPVRLPGDARQVKMSSGTLTSMETAWMEKLDANLLRLQQTGADEQRAR